MTDGRKKLSEAKLEKKLQTVFFFLSLDLKMFRGNESLMRE